MRRSLYECFLFLFCLSSFNSGAMQSAPHVAAPALAPAPAVRPALNARQYIRNMTIDGSQLPAEEIPANPQHSRFTVGDMHANIITIFHVLVTTGVLQYKVPFTDTTTQFDLDIVPGFPIHIQKGTIAELYGKLHNIVYQEATLLGEAPPPALEIEHYDEFKRLLHEIFNVNRAPYIRFIGDILADRTSNDVLTLALFGYLFEQNANIDIIYSNHDNMFFNMLNGSEYYYPAVIDSVSPSLKKAVTFNEMLRGFVRRLAPDDPERSKAERILNNINLNIHAYKEHLSLFQFDSHTGHIYSHAPFSNELFNACLTKMLEEVDPDSDIPEILAKPLEEKIEQANTLFKAILRPVVSDESKAWGINRREPFHSPHLRSLFDTWSLGADKSTADLFTRLPCYLTLWVEPTYRDTRGRMGDRNGRGKLDGAFTAETPLAHANIHGHTAATRRDNADATLDSNIGKASIPAGDIPIEHHHPARPPVPAPAHVPAGGLPAAAPMHAAPPPAPVHLP